MTHAVNLAAALLVIAMAADVWAQGLRAPDKPLPERVAEAEKVFVGVLTNRKLAADGQCTAELKVTRAIKGVKVGELVPVLWLPKVSGYDAREKQTGLAVLKYQHEKKYWLRPDTFADPKLADEAAKLAGAEK